MPVSSSRLHFSILIIGVLLFAPCPVVFCAEPATAPQESTLRRAAESLFPVGVGLNDRIADRVNDHALVLAQFSILTPENCMKPAHTQAAEGKWDFALADGFVDFATRNDLKVVGHCLVWAKDDRTPAWFFRDGDKPASREMLLQRMRRHIETEVTRYRGRMAMWDVVNEALDDGADYLRPSGWSKACGEEFIAKAFEYAHAADAVGRRADRALTSLAEGMGCPVQAPRARPDNGGGHRPPRQGRGPESHSRQPA